MGRAFTLEPKYNTNKKQLLPLWSISKQINTKHKNTNIAINPTKKIHVAFTKQYFFYQQTTRIYRHNE